MKRITRKRFLTAEEAAQDQAIRDQIAKEYPELFTQEARNEMKQTRIEIGEEVVCDVCNDRYTDSEESGGFLFGSYAYCPKCARDNIESIRSYGEEKYITVRCPDGMSFKQFCLNLRGGDNSITITEL